ncbi:MAG: tRNA pseudouridine(55) synthase TruB [Candidatus Omnitrophica bacterium]|nr:tRNA pseudouridine(55) synthase TruB [Candidatus Omnitrophota bacterium]
MDGIIVVNKEQGMTSHDVVAIVRRKLKMRRVGHAGTLDPLATGVLVILLGKCTKFFGRFQSMDKDYRATLILGTRTTTADIQGKIIETKPYQDITEKKIQDVMKKFLGNIEQIPPMVSAVKVGGKRLYELARKGIEVDRSSRQIRIDQLNLEAFCPPEVQFYVRCSKGTYVRKLAEDIGEALDSAACISKIERTRVGPFHLENSVKLGDLTEKNIQPPSVTF